MHCRFGGVAGTSIKPPDLCGAIGCSSCHDVLDGRTNTDFSREDILDFWLGAMNRSMAMVWKEFF